MDDKDKQLLNMIQEDFPVTPSPFSDIAAKLGCDETEVIARVRRLKQEGVIRRLGAVFDLRKLGFTSTLCAARVPEDSVADFVAVVNALPSVTHNYRRSHEYNLWFTLITPGEEQLRETLARIKTLTGIDDVLSLPAVRTFKINAKFEM
jgi:DNA-binding Lrp family transcriptional regulator